ncbi:hypothetical protein [Posidoniimonas corsicana]|uniref:hypothetical protein n=1 Tax=Posidoniimonas corsicana TaxID=1938618 RepID=UPI0011B5F235|nr:hypothetical protein [Posidoniimonas corsicana]
MSLPPLSPEDSQLPKSVVEYEHGWPLPYARRAIGYGGDNWREHDDSNAPLLLYPGGLFASWSIPDAWPVRGDEVELSVAALLLDLAVATAIVLGAKQLTEVCVRRWRRFRLADLLVVTALVGLTLGWRQWNIQLYQREDQVLLEVKAGGYFPGPRGHDSMTWLTRLIGTPETPLWRNHINRLSLNNSRLDLNSWPLLSDLPFLRTLRLHALPTQSNLDGLRSLEHLRDVTLLPPQPYAPAAHEEIDLRELSRLPCLEHLIIASPHVLIEDLEALLSSPRLKTVRVSILTNTEEVAAFRRRFRPRFELLLGLPKAEQLWQHDYSQPQWIIAARVARWQGRGAIDAFGSGELDFLDLADVVLTDERIDRLSAAHDFVDAVRLGTVTAGPKKLERFIQGFRWLDDLDLGEYQVTNRTLATLHNLPKLDFLSMRQGDLGPANIRSLATLPSLTGVEIYHSTLESAEVAEIEQAWESQRDIYLEVFRGGHQSNRVSGLYTSGSDEFGSDPFGGGDDPFVGQDDSNPFE